MALRQRPISNFNSVSGGHKTPFQYHSALAFTVW